MSEKRTRRGRPKGSGIDDRKPLAAIARLIASDPDLKPTTAIRTLGISDPSIIRRLRDKFNAARLDLMKDLNAPSTSPTPSTAPKAETKQSPKRSIQPKGANALPPSNRSNQAEMGRRTPAAVMAASAGSPQIRSARMKNGAVESARTIKGKSASRQQKTAGSKTVLQQSRQARDDDSERLRAAGAFKPDETTELFSSMLRASVTATSSFWAAQTAFANQFARSPYFTLALRQQLALSEWAIGMVPVFQIPNKTAT